jgi:tetratricopeptide (TPR) repeat protein
MIGEPRQPEQKAEQLDFNAPNWAFLRNNEEQTSFRDLEGGQEGLSDEHRAMLMEAADYYRASGDIFNLCKLEMKMGNIEEAEKLFNDFMGQEGSEEELVELKKGYLMRDLARVKKDKKLREQAINHFKQYGESLLEREDLGSVELSAISLWNAFKMTPKSEEGLLIREKCVNQYRKMAENRKAAGDRWWESIAIRQIGKISTDPSDKNKALKRADELVREYSLAGDRRKAALWARDISLISPSTKRSLRAENLWCKHLFCSAEGAQTREVAKSYWQLAKRFGTEPRNENYRREAIDWYRVVLEKAKESGDEKQIQESYRALCELIV